MVEHTGQSFLQNIPTLGFSKTLRRPLDLLTHFKSPQDSAISGPTEGMKLQAEFCKNARTLKQVYRLRYSIFTKEYGARIKSLRRLDKDRYDRYCDHLVVRAHPINRIVGYTRVLSCTASRSLDGFYTATEFDLNNLPYLQAQSAEIGRTCIHQDFRNGTTIATLWSCLAEYLKDNNIRYLFGCASIGLRDGGHQARAILQTLADKNVLDDSLMVNPRLPLTHLPTAKSKPVNHSRVSLPPLLKAYINMGAQVAPIPHWDTEFNVADLFILLDTNNLNPRYLKRFMKVASRKCA